MNYTLAVLTHGNDTSYLERAMESFTANVTPQPRHAILLIDGNESEHPYSFANGRKVESLTQSYFDEIFFTGGEGVGFCAATARLWGYAAFRQPHQPYVFWLEHDFEFTRTLDLGPLAQALAGDEILCQMALMRDAVNETEKAAGGLFESRRSEYVPVTALDIDGKWLEHVSYFTTNPSLMTRSFLLENAWPAYDSYCEGKFGIDLLAKGYRFGVWGDGQPWVRHIGVRNGKGY